MRPKKSGKNKNIENGKLQILNTVYERMMPHPEDNNAWYDTLTYVYRDEETGEKAIKEVQKPKFSYYMIKPEFETDYNLADISKDQGFKRTCNYMDLLKDMSMAMGAEQEFKKLKNQREMGKIKEMTFHSGLFFGADINIEDYSIIQWVDQNKEAKCNKITKSYLDIECDTTGYKGFPDEHIAPCPINVITFINGENETSYSFILRHHSLKTVQDQIYKLEEEVESGKFQRYLNKKFREDFGELDYQLYFYDKEEVLLEECFACIHQLKPDFCSIWNMTFDILTIMNRWEHLTGKPKEMLFCHPDFSNAVCNFYEDTRHQKHGDKNTSLTCTSYTVFNDALINFAAIRRGMGERESYKLTDICREEIGQTKEKFDEDANSLTDLIIRNFKKFITYNIKDVLLMKKLEEKNQDIDTLYQISLLTGTRYTATMRKTISLFNLKYLTFMHQGNIPCCNMNTNYTGGGEAGESFEGALVANPLLNDHEGIEIYGNKSMFIFNNVIDFDLAALYPNIIRAFNVSITTQYGKLVMEENNQITDKEGDRMIQSFMDALNSRDYAYIAIRFFGLEPIEKLAQKLELEMAGA